MSSCAKRRICFEPPAQGRRKTRGHLPLRPRDQRQGDAAQPLPPRADRRGEPHAFQGQSRSGLRPSRLERRGKEDDPRARLGRAHPLRRELLLPGKAWARERRFQPGDGGRVPGRNARGVSQDAESTRGKMTLRRNSEIAAMTSTCPEKCCRAKSHRLQEIVFQKPYVILDLAQLQFYRINKNIQAILLTIGRLGCRVRDKDEGD